MRSLSSEQTKVIIAQYWGQKVAMLNMHAETLHTVNNVLFERFNINMLLALTPLEKMDTVDACQFIRILYPDCRMIKGIVISPIKICFKKKLKYSYVSGEIVFSKMSPQQFQWCLMMGYAPPLFIGPDHPENGKTAIEMDIAIDKTLITFKD